MGANASSSLTKVLRYIGEAKVFIPSNADFAGTKYYTEHVKEYINKHSLPENTTVQFFSNNSEVKVEKKTYEVVEKKTFEHLYSPFAKYNCWQYLPSYAPGIDSEWYGLFEHIAKKDMFAIDCKTDLRTPGRSQEGVQEIWFIIQWMYWDEILQGYQDKVNSKVSTHRFIFEVIDSFLEEVLGKVNQNVAIIPFAECFIDHISDESDVHYNATTVKDKPTKILALPLETSNQDIIINLLKIHPNRYICRLSPTHPLHLEYICNHVSKPNLKQKEIIKNLSFMRVSMLSVSRVNGVFLLHMLQNSYIVDSMLRYNIMAKFVKFATTASTEKTTLPYDKNQDVEEFKEVHKIEFPEDIQSTSNPNQLDCDSMHKEFYDYIKRHPKILDRAEPKLTENQMKWIMQKFDMDIFNYLDNNVNLKNKYKLKFSSVHFAVLMLVEAIRLNKNNKCSILLSKYATESYMSSTCRQNLNIVDIRHRSIGISLHTLLIYGVERFNSLQKHIGSGTYEPHESKNIIHSTDFHSFYHNILDVDAFGLVKEGKPTFTYECIHNDLKNLIVHLGGLKNITSLTPPVLADMIPTSKPFELDMTNAMTKDNGSVLDLIFIKLHIVSKLTVAMIVNIFCNNIITDEGLTFVQYWDSISDSIQRYFEKYIGTPNVGKFTGVGSKYNNISVSSLMKNCAKSEIMEVLENPRIAHIPLTESDGFIPLIQEMSSRTLYELSHLITILICARYGILDMNSQHAQECIIEIIQCCTTILLPDPIVIDNPRAARDNILNDPEDNTPLNANLRLIVWEEDVISNPLYAPKLYAPKLIQYRMFYANPQWVEYLNWNSEGTKFYIDQLKSKTTEFKSLSYDNYTRMKSFIINKLELNYHDAIDIVDNIVRHVMPRLHTQFETNRNIIDLISTLFAKYTYIRPQYNIDQLTKEYSSVKSILSEFNRIVYRKKENDINELVDNYYKFNMFSISLDSTCDFMFPIITNVGDQGCTLENNWMIMNIPHKDSKELMSEMITKFLKIYITDGLWFCENQSTQNKTNAIHLARWVGINHISAASESKYHSNIGQFYSHLNEDTKKVILMARFLNHSQSAFPYLGEDTANELLYDIIKETEMTQVGIIRISKNTPLTLVFRTNIRNPKNDNTGLYYKHIHYCVPFLTWKKWIKNTDLICEGSSPTILENRINSKKMQAFIRMGVYNLNVGVPIKKMLLVSSEYLVNMHAKKCGNKEGWMRPDNKARVDLNNPKIFKTVDEELSMPNIDPTIFNQYEWSQYKDHIVPETLAINQYNTSTMKKRSVCYDGKFPRVIKFGRGSNMMKELDKKKSKRIRINKMFDSEDYYFSSTWKFTGDIECYEANLQTNKHWMLKTQEFTSLKILKKYKKTHTKGGLPTDYLDACIKAWDNLDDIMGQYWCTNGYRGDRTKTILLSWLGPDTVAYLSIIDIESLEEEEYIPNIYSKDRKSWNTIYLLKELCKTPGFYPFINPRQQEALAFKHKDTAVVTLDYTRVGYLNVFFTEVGTKAPPSFEKGVETSFDTLEKKKITFPISKLMELLSEEEPTAFNPHIALYIHTKLITGKNLLISNEPYELDAIVCDRDPVKPLDIYDITLRKYVSDINFKNNVPIVVGNVLFATIMTTFSPMKEQDYYKDFHHEYITQVNSEYQVKNSEYQVKNNRFHEWLMNYEFFRKAYNGFPGKGKDDASNSTRSEFSKVAEYTKSGPGTYGRDDFNMTIKNLMKNTILLDLKDNSTKVNKNKQIIATELLQYGNDMEVLAFDHTPVSYQEGVQKFFKPTPYQQNIPQWKLEIYKRKFMSRFKSGFSKKNLDSRDIVGAIDRGNVEYAVKSIKKKQSKNKKLGPKETAFMEKTFPGFVPPEEKEEEDQSSVFAKLKKLKKLAAKAMKDISVTDPVHASVAIPGIKLQPESGDYLGMIPDNNRLNEYNTDGKNDADRYFQKLNKDEFEKRGCETGLSHIYPAFKISEKGQVLARCGKRNWITESPFPTEDELTSIDNKNGDLLAALKNLAIHWCPSIQHQVMLWRWVGVGCLGRESYKVLVNLTMENSRKSSPTSPITRFSSMTQYEQRKLLEQSWKDSISKTDHTGVVKACRHRIAFLLEMMSTSIFFPYIKNEIEARRVAESKENEDRVVVTLDYNTSGNVIMIRAMSNGDPTQIEIVPVENMIDYSRHIPTLVRLEMFRMFSGGVAADNTEYFKNSPALKGCTSPDMVNMRVYAVRAVLPLNMQRELDILIEKKYKLHRRALSKIQFETESKHLQNAFDNIREFSKMIQGRNLTTKQLVIFRSILKLESSKEKGHIIVEKGAIIQAQVASNEIDRIAKDRVTLTLCNDPKLIPKIREMYKKIYPETAITEINQMTRNMLCSKLLVHSNIMNFDSSVKLWDIVNVPDNLKSNTTKLLDLWNTDEVYQSKLSNWLLSEYGLTVGQMKRYNKEYKEDPNSLLLEGKKVEKYLQSKVSAEGVRSKEMRVLRDHLSNGRKCSQIKKPEQCNEIKLDGNLCEFKKGSCKRVGISSIVYIRKVILAFCHPDVYLGLNDVEFIISIYKTLYNYFKVSGKPKQLIYDSPEKMCRMSIAMFTTLETDLESRGASWINQTSGKLSDLFTSFQYDKLNKQFKLFNNDYTPIQNRGEELKDTWKTIYELKIIKQLKLVDIGTFTVMALYYSACINDILTIPND